MRDTSSLGDSFQTASRIDSGYVETGEDAARSPTRSMRRAGTDGLDSGGGAAWVAPDMGKVSGQRRL